METLSGSFRKFKALCGILSPLVLLVLVSLAVAGSPWLSWTNNWLSDIGGEDGDRPIWWARGTPSLLFNLGLVLGGLLGLLFWQELKQRLPVTSERGRQGLSCVGVQLVALTLIGVFPITLSILHMIVALVFFFLAPVSLYLIGEDLYQQEKRRDQGQLWMRLASLSAVAFVLLGIPRPWGGNALVELVPAVCLTIFSVYYALEFLGWSGRAT